MNDLPDANYATLKFFLGAYSPSLVHSTVLWYSFDRAGHLSRIAQHADANQMSVSNLAIVFGPTLFLVPAGQPQGSGGEKLPFQNKVRSQLSRSALY